MRMTNMNMGLIGNCAYNALINDRGCVTWCCLPRPDGDPVFHALLGSGAQDRGLWAIELAGMSRQEQFYEGNSAVLVTRLWDDEGNGLEIRDHAPRFMTRERVFRPLSIVRRVAPLAGTPRIRVRLRPAFDYGGQQPEMTYGSNHVRYAGGHPVLRLTTSAPVPYILDETEFLLEEPVAFLLGPDETLQGSVDGTARDFEERTLDYWKEWSRSLTLPLQWQDAVIRSSITLKLCTYEPTGAIVAAVTTSLPEAAHSQRNWDYRYCWLRDAFFVVRALNSLSKVTTMENYLKYLANIVSRAQGGHLQPVYGIALEPRLTEGFAEHLPGYRGMGPVRVGNQAFEHLQHDAYGNVVLAAAQSFFDRRLLRPGSAVDFERLEGVGERAWQVYHTPDAGMWELRHRARVHTSSALMCWAACDRLAKIARHLGREQRAVLWRDRANTIRKAIESEAWNEEIGSYVESFGGKDIDAGLLLMAEVGFHPADDARFIGTVSAVERTLKRGKHLFRYAAADDFGEPENAFTICTFWYIDALTRIGRREEALEIFEEILSCRNHLGLLSEDVDPKTRELWGNFPQTYSMVGIINAAMRLSRPWEDVV